LIILQDSVSSVQHERIVAIPRQKQDLWIFRQKLA